MTAWSDLQKAKYRFFYGHFMQVSQHTCKLHVISPIISDKETEALWEWVYFFN